MIPEHIQNRKGARSFNNLDQEVIDYLNQGKIETANLIEWLAVDQLKLVKLILKDLDKSHWYDSFYEAISVQKKPTANTNTKIIGLTFMQLSTDQSILEYLSNHISDVPRCWATYWAAMQETEIINRLRVIEQYAGDSHFGVREVAIFATKDLIIDHLDKALNFLLTWVSSKDDNIRRYAIEVIRPIGVWTKKIDDLKENPEKGLPLLTPLQSDSSKYVRDSVGNWLNDASKTRPEWVQQICNDWEKQSATKETKYIIKKALRSLNKA
ncbi:DNA alkylation repair protein [Aquimarina sp. AD10]|uniref:DNA alkylation repair protein n=1 Tax=Aquimarina sp. AD10 TaxID=1714849 RepID=UPI0018F729AD|nr:DNA alkylation repair protein [Aquimarina sp. AD10]